MIKIEIPIKSVPKGRPRLGKNGCVYTPRKTERFETELFFLAKDAYDGPPLEGPISANIQIIFKKAKRSKHKYPAFQRTGDIDNHLKSIFDAISGYLFRDDSQIVECVASKKYGERDTIKIRLENIDEHDDA